MSEAEKLPDAEERRQLRPYRRVVGLLFTIVLLFGAVVVLRGIIRHLDRLPSVEAMYKTPTVDVRALRACAEDLEKLDTRVRIAAGRAFSELPAEEAPPRDWATLSSELELERLSIVARCRLHEPSEDPAVKDLEDAANHLEAMMRSYALLYARHLEDGLHESEEARKSLRRATGVLRTR